MRHLLLLILLAYSPILLFAQKRDSTSTEPLIERLTYQQQPGLALAASKIFFSEKPYSISGFGEVNYVRYGGPKDRNVGDIELYYTNLYRYATFFGYRFTPNWIWNSEFQIEYLHDGTVEGQTEIVIEAFTDYIFNDYFKARAGFYPLTIGYVNNNDEPIMFYSVNRSEVERIILPSTWIELGVMFYGNITSNLSYALGFSQGLNSSSYLGSTWIRQGREIRLEVPKRISINPQLNYTGFENITLSVSGYFGNSGQNERVILNGTERKINAAIHLYSGYFMYENEDFGFRFVSTGTYGKLGDTDLIFQQSVSQASIPQVLGEEVYGYLFEAGYDLFHLFGKPKGNRSNFIWDAHESKLPVFLRYERLNTHHRITPSLQNEIRFQNDLDILTAGINFNTRENVVFKLNYQFRSNRFSGLKESNIFEAGFGFIF